MKRKIMTGATILALLSGTFSSAVLADTIDVQNGTQVYMNGEKINMTDDSGNPVEAFIYKGTTYLPARAITEANGNKVTWENGSVYLEKTAEKNANEKDYTKANLVSEAERDYTFELSDNVERTHVTFYNRYGIELAADLYTPKNIDKTKKYSAVAVAGPFGAVKEQASGLYAEEMAQRGFVALAFDPSFIGESGGKARNVASPDINTEDFSAAVDFLSTTDYVDSEKIGIIGICGFGGMALNAAVMDTRIKATVSSTMYDMTRVNANGYFDEGDSEEVRYETKKTLNAQRTEDFKNGDYKRAGGVVDPLPDDAPYYVKDYYDYYKTNRGYTKRSLNSNDGWNMTSSLSFINMPILQYSDEIRSAVLLIHGENAHSKYFSEDAFKQLKGDNKELLIIPDAVHTDLYDDKDKIPFDKLETFFNEYLK